MTKRYSPWSGGLETSFVRISSDWKAEQAVDLLQGVPASRAIVHYQAPGGPTGSRFYSYSYEDLLERLRRKSQETVWDALEPSESAQMQTVAWYPALTDAGSLVIDRGLILGVATPSVRAATGGDLPRESPRVLVATAPPEVAIGAEVSLLVKISAEAGTAGTLPVFVKAGDRIDIVVQASGGLVVSGRSEGTLTIDEQPESTTLRFKIGGREIRPGPGKASVYAFKDGQDIGSITVGIKVVPTSVESGTTEWVGPMRAPLPVPDLSLLVFENKAERSYTMRLNAADPRYGLNFTPYGPIHLDANVESFFADFYRDIEAILSANESPAGKAGRLSKKGTYLFEKLVPEPMRKQLWDLRSRIHSVQIQSEEPWIPWELCKLVGEQDGRIVEGGFLCEDFGVTRWLLGVKQQISLSLRTLGLVVPGNSGLLASPAERDYVRSLARDGRTVTEIPARTVDLLSELASAKYDGLHFTGHGSALTGNADRSEIKLENDERFSPEDLTGVVANLGKGRHPLVFLNACEIGRGGASLVGMGGWAQGFLKAGAGAFVGPYWKIADASASLFAQTFYDGLIAKGLSVGDAARDARLAIKQANDPTWLAYTIYAHPDASVQVHA